MKGTRLARIGETSIHSFIFIQILVIDLDRIYLNESGSLTICRFGISIHHSFNIKLERIKIRGYLKLSPSEVIDDRLERSIINSFISISLSIFNEQDSSS